MTTVWALLVFAVVVQAQTDELIQKATFEAWWNCTNQLCDRDVQYNTKGPTLFTYVDESKLETPTWNYFKQLLTAYNINEQVPDVCDAACQQLELDFVDALFDTNPIKVAHEFIQTYDASLKNETAFKDWLHYIWFTPYNRHADNDSSGFQHVFVGEMKVEPEVGGMHNWYQIYTQEKLGNWILNSTSSLCQPDEPKFSFSWNGNTKPVNSVWMRSTPEQEFAIYSLCFKFRPNGIFNARLDNYLVPIQTWDQTIPGGPVAIGSSYAAC